MYKCVKAWFSQYHSDVVSTKLTYYGDKKSLRRMWGKTNEEACQIIARVSPKLTLY